MAMLNMSATGIKHAWGWCVCVGGGGGVWGYHMRSEVSSTYLPLSKTVLDSHTVCPWQPHRHIPFQILPTEEIEHVLTQDQGIHGTHTHRVMSFSSGSDVSTTSAANPKAYKEEQNKSMSDGRVNDVRPISGSNNEDILRGAHPTQIANLYNRDLVLDIYM